jgi:hypothetical protein
MGRNAKKEAKKKGFKKLPMITLYGRPKSMKMMFSKYKPDTVREIGAYMKSIDPSFVETSSGGGRNNTFYMLDEQQKLYVELLDKMAGFNVHNASNHVEKIDIYTENQNHVQKIAKVINGIWDDGIFPHMEWEKLEKKYKVGKDQIKTTWEKYLSGQIEAPSSPQASGEGKVCEKCGKQNLTSSNFCVECGENLQ